MTSQSDRGIGLIGAGNVGLVLAAALQRARYVVVGACASPRTAPRVREVLQAPVVQQPGALRGVSRTLIIAVPDDAVADVVADLAASGRWEGVLVAHTSGRHGAGILEPLRRLGATVLAMHPAMAFAGHLEAELERLPGTTFTVTSPNGGVEEGSSLVRAMGGKPVVLAEEDRALYHAAMTHGSSHLATLVAEAASLLELLGVEDPGAALRPLLHASVENALEHGVRGITGPMPRGDVGTIADHVRAIQERAADMLPSYLAMAQATLAAAVRAGRLTPEQATALNRTLQS